MLEFLINRTFMNNVSFDVWGARKLFAIVWKERSRVLEFVDDIRGRRHEHIHIICNIHVYNRGCLPRKNINDRVYCSGRVEKVKVNPIKIKHITEISYRCFPCTPAEKKSYTSECTHKVIWKFFPVNTQVDWLWFRV